MNALAMILSLAAVASGVATYAALSSWGGEGPSATTVLILLNIDLFLLLALGVLVSHHVARLWTNQRSGASGSRLHVRLALLFGVVAITPAIVMMVFAALLFTLGVESWFSERVRTALVESSEVAEAYLAEHIQVIRADALSVASDINRQWPQLNRSNDVLNRFLSNQAGLRGLTEAVIFRDDMQVIAKAGYTFALQTGEQIPLSVIAQANMGEVAVLTGEGGDRVRALVRLEALPGNYLYVGRFIDAKVLGRVARTQDAVDEYLLLESRRSDIEISFTLLFIVVALLLLVASVWFGLTLATRLAKPIVDLIEASERVRQGDLSVRVEEKAASDEIASLGRAFNRMTSRLGAQREALVEANSQLDERRRFTEAVLSGVTAGVIGLDPEGKITLPNKAASELLGVSLNDGIGLPLAGFVPEFLPLIDEVKSNRDRTIERETPVKRNGKARAFLVRLTIEQTDNRIVGFVFTFDDITELQAAQRKAAWADVARRIAHEIKNPLTPIQLSAERLKKRYLSRVGDDTGAFELCTDTIIRHVTEIGQMVDEFSSFARMPQPTMAVTDIVELAKSAVVLPQTAYRHIAIDLAAPSDEVLVNCDAPQIRQAIANILKNAIEAIESKTGGSREEGAGKITVEVGVRHNEAFIEVTDDGVGLPEDDIRQRLTEPYITTRSKGTGLGLAIVWKIIEDHRGRLDMEDAPGGGAKVSFWFPMAEKSTDTSQLNVGDDQTDSDHADSKIIAKSA
ncbi:MAG: PAS domain-containing sensor histidine kinase [Rhodospirillaceae bacterium]|nr:PAS domain-containing sensor histidine kinase [Rhodospirillaceae bacterium]MBT5239852.1 PAS domain-containing sensor histidine kinase [Rhodospirillaceae bacterium]MBT5567132.1 PAS domain-containing sensor histidine kinase [Rhodospirillaceae bacterium]MBT6089345.1 PAS domain-containing sensor histidine kinase [Rhodospirillaceae bacterium]